MINVPLLSGEFALSWKVQHAVSSSSRKGSSVLSQLLAEMDERPKITVNTSNEGLGVRRSESTRRVPSADVDAADSVRSGESQAVFASPASETSAGTGAREGIRSPKRGGGADSNGSVESLAESAIDGPRSPTEPTWNRLRQLRDDPRRSRNRSGSFSGRGPSANAPGLYTESKGQTAFERLQKHTVKYDRKIEVVVRVPIGKADVPDVERDTDSAKSPRPDATAAGGVLGETNMFIKVEQQVRSVSGSKTQEQETHSTFGSVQLNLAEYAPPSLASAPPSTSSSSHTSGSSTGVRTETRQYLLDDCMANALLRLTVEARYLGAAPVPYRVPPIHGGIVDLASIMAPEPSEVPELEAGPEVDSESLAEQRVEWTQEHPGLEWHYKLPMSQLFHTTAVCPEHLRTQDADEPAEHASGTQLQACDASAPRLMYCDTNTERLIDDLFEGHLGPAADEREPPTPLSPTTQQQHTTQARRRWDKLVQSVGAIALQADPTRPLRQASHRREGSVHSTESDEESSHLQSPLSLHTPRLGEFVDMLRHNLSSGDAERERAS